MRFPRTVITTELHSPPHFEEDIHFIEYREDPLTGLPCRLNAKRAARRKQGQEKADWGPVVRKPADCPFCPENIAQATPRLPQAVFASGRMARGECSLFPNLFPLAEYHANVVLSRAHFLDLEQFDAERIADGFMLARDYVLRVCGHSSEAKYPLVIWNHLSPGAASVVHPHLQVLVDRRPTFYQQRLLDRSRGYFISVGTSFWRDIVAEEKARGERYIGGDGPVAVIASYAPQGNREAQFIFEGVSSLGEVGDEQIRQFACCLNRVLCGYKEMGVNSFNVSTFSIAVGERREYYSLHAKVISRPVLQPFYRNDSGALEKLHGEADIEMAPELLAARLRAFF